MGLRGPKPKAAYERIPFRREIWNLAEARTKHLRSFDESLRKMLQLAYMQGIYDLTHAIEKESECSKQL